MNYYHDLVTEKSWRELQQLQRRLGRVHVCQSSETPPSRVQQLLAEYKLRPAWQTFGQFLDEYTQLPELNLNVHQYSRLKQSIGL